MLRQVARLLKRFPVRPKAQWIDGKTHQGYKLEDLQDAFSRYLPSIDPQGPQESNNDAKNSGFAIPKADPLLGVGKGGEGPVGTRGLGDLGDGNTPSVGNNAEVSATDLLANPKKTASEIIEGEL